MKNPFKTRFKDYMKRKSCTQIKLALELHVSKETLSRYLNLANPFPLDVFERACEYLGIYDKEKQGLWELYEATWAERHKYRGGKSVEGNVWYTLKSSVAEVLARLEVAASPIQLDRINQQAVTIALFSAVISGLFVFLIMQPALDTSTALGSSGPGESGTDIFYSPIEPHVFVTGIHRICTQSDNGGELTCKVDDITISHQKSSGSAAPCRDEYNWAYFYDRTDFSNGARKLKYRDVGYWQKFKNHTFANMTSSIRNDTACDVWLLDHESSPPAILKVSAGTSLSLEQTGLDNTFDQIYIVPMGAELAGL